jgi:hypothetical protein
MTAVIFSPVRSFYRSPLCFCQPLSAILSDKCKPVQVQQFSVRLSLTFVVYQQSGAFLEKYKTAPKAIYLEE